jgi:hypothetical protein
MFLNKLIAFPILFNVFSMIFQSLVRESPVASNSLLNPVTAYPTNSGAQKVSVDGFVSNISCVHSTC